MLYEEFLSGYFAHTKWKVRKLIGWLLKDPQFDRKKGKSGNLTHSWTHIPTSEISIFRLSDKDGNRYGSVRSAFFYLEQPALFPLLCHESAHFYFPEDSDLRDQSENFFTARVKATETLKQAFPFPLDNKGWLGMFTTEIWIDAISIRLEGIPYVSALFSQIFGFSTPSNFSRMRSEEGIFVLDEMGTDELRTHVVHYPDGYDDGYLWEARLMLAAKLCKRIGAERASVPEKAWLDSCEQMIITWQKGGAVANLSSNTSKENETFWEYRKKINQWVVDVIWCYMEPQLVELRNSPISWNYYFNSSDPANPVGSSPVKAIEKAVRSYFTETLLTSIECAEKPLLEDLQKIDACPMAVRWVVSQRLVQEKIIFSQYDSYDDFCDWVRIFSDYVRHDGHSAFRIAMEWHIARESVFACLAKLIAKQDFKDDSCEFDEFSEILEQIKSKDEKTIQNILCWLRFHRFDNAITDPSILDDLAKGIREHADKYADKVTELILASWKSDESGIPVGTLTLGLIRPSEMAAYNASCPCNVGCAYNSHCSYIRDYPYHAAALRTRNYFKEQYKQLNATLETVKTKSKYASVFLRLVGDYSFLHFLEGSTPVERDIHPVRLPKMLTKPRAVLKIDEEENIAQLPFGKVTLLRDQYRFMWVKLIDRLKELKVPYTLYLSSGWEDVVLVTWHDSMANMQESRKILGLLYSGQSKDAQSSMAVNLHDDDYAKVVGNRNRNKWDVKNDDWLKNFSVFLDENIEARYETTGRYDYKIVWNENVDSPQKMLEAMDSLPREFWKPVTTYSSSIQQILSSDFITKNGSESQFVTRLVLE